MALPKNESELQAQLAAARDEGKASVQVPDVAAATAAAVTADRNRRQAIMALPEAEKRQKLAATLADGDYTVDQATALLKVAAEETPAVVVPPQQEQQQEQQQDQQRSQFEQRMDQDGPAGVGAGGGNGGGGAPAGENKELAAASSILADQAAFGGARHRTFKAPGSVAAN
jgi:phage repressor protein C with HTH and peptisase S24 domain